MSKIVLAWKLFWRIWRFLQEVQQDAKQRLSPERARVDRLATERWLDELWIGRDEGWRKYITFDDDLIEYGRQYLKSAKLDAVVNGSSLDCAKARDAMRSQGGMRGYHQP